MKNFIENLKDEKVKKSLSEAHAALMKKEYETIGVEWALMEAAAIYCETGNHTKVREIVMRRAASHGYKEDQIKETLDLLLKPLPNNAPKEAVKPSKPKTAGAVRGKRPKPGDPDYDPDIDAIPGIERIPGDDEEDGQEGSEE